MSDDDRWRAGETDGKSRRPSERQLVAELKAERHSLLDGFDSRRKVLEWAQRVVVRTLGQIPQKRYEQLAKSFKPDTDNLEGPLLAAFLTADARTRDMDANTAQGLRERWAAKVLGSVQVRAFRSLRKDATEYVGETERDDGRSGDPGYDPDEQSFAMRPALSELDGLQAHALTMLVGNDTHPSGLPDRSAILDWGDVLVSATRGEPIAPGYDEAFIPKAYREPSTVDLLTDRSPPYRRAREAFAAHWLLPAFNRGVRDLEGRTAEEPANPDSDDPGPTGG